jgi:flagellar M-ring protein FliF
MDSFLNRLKQLGSAFTTGQLVTLALTFVLVIGVVVGSAMWLNTPSFRLLMRDADQETMAQVVQRLKDANVPYQIDDLGGGIRVPANRVDELRLEILSQGMPGSGRPGWEILDQTRLGVTDFVEKANYRRALEGEIARTIATISEVAGARVHIAIGKDTPFGQPRPTTASVVVKLKGDRPLPGPAVSGITNLVAYSVEGLRPESVVVVDSQGRPLSQPKEDDNDPQGAANLDRQQRMEKELEGKVASLLEPVVGAGRVRVNVALRLNAGSVEQIEDVYDPNATVMRSRQTSTDTSSSGATLGPAVAAGIVPGTAGARGNTPPPNTPPPAQLPPQATVQGPGLVATGTAAAPPIQMGPSSSRNTETINQEISKVTRKTTQPAGGVARQSVAVVIDHKDQVKTENGTTTVTRVPRTAEELQQIQELVSSAVGFDMERGDKVTVQNISFQEPVADDLAEPGLFQQYAPYIDRGGQVGGFLIVVALTFLFVIRPLMSRLTAPAVFVGAGAAAAIPAPLPPLAPGQRPRTVAEMESAIAAQLDAQAQQVPQENLKLPVLTKRIAEASTKEPEYVAKVLRSWMNEQAR